MSLTIGFDGTNHAEGTSVAQDNVNVAIRQLMC